MLKGATGVGAPFLAIPIMAVLVDVSFAVAVFLISNIIANVGQVFRYRASMPDRRLTFGFAAVGMIGAAVGTFALAELPGLLLTNVVAIVVLIYVAFRLFNPSWSLSWETAVRVFPLVGAIGGLFQGAIGLSGPIAITFINAIGLPRPQFIVTMSLYFFAMTLTQFPIQIALGIMTWERFTLGVLALLPLLAGMALGEIIGRRMSKATFDRIIIVVLTLLALRLLAQNVL